MIAIDKDRIDHGPQMAYAGVKRALALLQPFRHGESMSGGWDAPGTTYYVFSYRTCIALINVWGEVVLDSDRYSVTTSRQQGMVKGYLGRSYEWGPEAGWGPDVDAPETL